MGDNNLELDVYLQMHMGEMDASSFDEIKKAATNAGKEIEKAFSDGLNNVLGSLASLREMTTLLSMQAKQAAKLAKSLQDAAKAAKEMVSVLKGETNVDDSAKQLDNIEKTAEASKEVAKNLDSMDSFEGLDTMFKNLKTGFKTMSVAVGTVTAGLKLWEKYLSLAVNAIKSLKNLTIGIAKPVIDLNTNLITTVAKFNLLTASLKGLKNIASGVSSAFASLIPDISFKDIASQSLELASSLTEIQNVIDQVFGKGNQAINEFASNAIKQLGMTGGMAKQFAGKFGAAMRSTGQAASDTLEMSKALTQLTSDIASFYDIEQDLAAEKLFSGVISGMIKPMRTLGVDMTNASLNAWMLSKGLNSTYESLDAASKQAIRFEYVMEKLDYVHGDYARTINSTANQIRLLKNQFKELGAALGSIINLVFNPFIIALNQIMSGITGVVKSIAAALGVDWSFGAGGAVSTLEDLADSYDALSNAEEGVADSTDKAAKSAKKALAPFHKLNVLQNKANADSGASKNKTSGSDIGLQAQQLERAGAELPSIQEMFNRFFAWIHGLDTAALLSDIIEATNDMARAIPEAFDNLWKNTRPYVQKITALFNMFVEQVDWNAWGNAINSAFKFVGNVINTFLQGVHFGSIGQAFADFVNGLMKDTETFKLWGENLGMAIQGVFDALLVAVNQIKWEQIGENIFTFVKSGFDKLSPARWFLAVSTGLSGISTAINTFVTSILKDETLISDIVDAIVALPLALANYLGGSGFPELIKNCGELVRTLFSGINQSLSTTDPTTGFTGYEAFGRGLYTLLEEAIKTITSEDFQRLASNLVKSFMDAINTAFKGHPLLKSAFLDLFGIDSIKWEALTVAVDVWNKDLNKVDTTARQAASSVEMFAKSNNAAYEAMIKAGASSEEIQKAADAWYKNQDAATQYTAVLDNIASSSSGVFNYLVIDSEKARAALEAQGQSTETLNTAMEKLGLSTDYLRGQSESVIKITSDQVQMLKDLGINLDSASAGVKLLSDTEIAGFREMGISVDEYASGVKTSFDGEILPKLWDARSATDDLSIAQIEAAAIAEKYGYSEEEALAAVQRASADTVNAIAGDVDRHTNILNGLSTQYQSTSQDIINADNNIEARQNALTKNAESNATSFTGILKDTGEKIGTAVNDSVERANSYVGNLYGTDTASTVASNTQTNVVDPIASTVDTGLANADLSSKILSNIEDPDLKAKLTEYLNTNVGASLLELNTFLAENGNILVDADGNIIGSTPESVQTATSQSLSGVNTAIDEKRLELASGEHNLLTQDGALLGETQESVYTSASGVLLGINTALAETNTNITTAMTTLRTDIETLFIDMPSWFTTNVFSIIQTDLDTLQTTIETNTNTRVATLESRFTEFVSFFKTSVIDAISTNLETLQQAIEDAFITSVNEVESKWKGLTDSITSNMSSMKSAIDSAASSLDNLISKLKEAASAQREYNSAKSARSSSSGNSGYHIQGYASGGVFKPNNPQLALLGDHKSQTEYALTTGHLQKIANMMADAIGSSGYEGNITIPIYVDGVLTDQKVITASQMHNYRSNGR